MWGTKRYRERDENQQLWIVRTNSLAKIPSTCAISLKRKRHNIIPNSDLMVKAIEKFQEDKNYLIVYTGRRAIHASSIILVDLQIFFLL